MLCFPGEGSVSRTLPQQMLAGVGWAGFSHMLCSHCVLLFLGLLNDFLYLFLALGSVSSSNCGEVLMWWC